MKTVTTIIIAIFLLSLISCRRNYSASPETLTKNYQITFAATSEGKALGELSAFSSSPEISISGPLNSDRLPRLLDVTGSLAEKDGEILFRYHIDCKIPVNTSNITTSGNTPSGGTASATSQSFEYVTQSSQGMLRMQAGTPYEVLKAAGDVYTVTITQGPVK